MIEKHHVKHRETARVLIFNSKGEVFLLKTHFDPEVGLPPRWLTPGGGIDPGEDTKDAAIRELFEETGLKIELEQLGEPVLVTEGRWDWADGKNYHTYQDTIFELEINDFEIDTSGFTSDEVRDVLEYRWWNIPELIASGESVGPHELSDYLLHRFG